MIVSITEVVIKIIIIMVIKMTYADYPRQSTWRRKKPWLERETGEVKKSGTWKNNEVVNLYTTISAPNTKQINKKTNNQTKWFMNLNLLMWEKKKMKTKK